MCKFTSKAGGVHVEGTGSQLRFPSAVTNPGYSQSQMRTNLIIPHQCTQHPSSTSHKKLATEQTEVSVKKSVHAFCCELAFLLAEGIFCGFHCAYLLIESSRS